MGDAYAAPDLPRNPRSPVGPSGTTHFQIGLPVALSSAINVASSAPGVQMILSPSISGHSLSTPVSLDTAVRSGPCHCGQSNCPQRALCARVATVRRSEIVRYMSSRERQPKSRHSQNTSIYSQSTSASSLAFRFRRSEFEIRVATVLDAAGGRDSSGLRPHRSCLQRETLTSAIQRGHRKTPHWLCLGEKSKLLRRLQMKCRKSALNSRRRLQRSLCLP